MSKCHAGEKNILISADGKVYACLTGAFYKERGRRDDFCLGDLRESSLDEILLNRERREKVSESVDACEGCSNPCELTRETHLFHQGIFLRKEEINDAFRLEETRRMGKALLDYNNWYAIENYEDDKKLCWSSGLSARLFLPTTGYKNGKVELSYRKLTSDTKIKFFFNEKEVFIDNDEVVQKTIQLDIEADGCSYVIVDFLVDKLRSPSIYLGSEDCRCLGIGLERIRLCNSRVMGDCR